VVGAYLAVVAISVFIIWRRGSEAREIEGVGAVTWPAGRPAVSYVAAETLRAGHVVREQDLVIPAVSSNLASALPRRSDLLGKYVVMTIPAGSAVEADRLTRRPPRRPVPPGLQRVRLAVDTTTVKRINAGVRIWLTRTDTLVAEAQVEHVYCQSGSCDASLLVDSAAAARVTGVGTRVPALNITVPIVQRSQ
jgi:hypothetical protein